MEDMKIVKTVNSKEEMKKLIIKYPGIAFVRGMKFGGKEMEVGQEVGQEVSRIVEASKVLKILGQEEVRLGLVFVPLVVGREGIQIHVMDWEEMDMGRIGVIFKRRGTGGRMKGRVGRNNTQGPEENGSEEETDGEMGKTGTQIVTEKGHLTGKKIVMPRGKAKVMANTILVPLKERI